MAWVGDAVFSLGMALVARLTANCPESPETVQRDLRELGPDAMLAPPRIWENMLTRCRSRAATPRRSSAACSSISAASPSAAS